MNLEKHFLKSKQFINYDSLVKQIDKSIKLYNWDCILPELPLEAVLVGGYIRDLILGKTFNNPDIDIIVPSNSLEIAKEISIKHNTKFIVLDKAREIVRVIFKDFIIDISPQLGNSLTEDLTSRDLTINSIAYSFSSRSIIDPSHGLKDLYSSFLRTNDTENLVHDPLRMLRCFRFYAEMDFEIDPEIIDFISLHKKKLSEVSVERIQNELKKIVCGEFANRANYLINKIELFDWIQSYENLTNNNIQYLKDSSSQLLKSNPSITFFYLTEILSNSTLKKFKFSKSEISNVRNLRKWKNKLIHKSISQFSERERFDLHKELEDILPALIVYLPRELQNKWLTRWRNNADNLFHPKNIVDGNTLKSFINIEEGPLLGDLLAYLSREFAYDRLNGFDDAIYKAKQWFKQNAPKCD